MSIKQLKVWFKFLQYFLDDLQYVDMHIYIYMTWVIYLQKQSHRLWIIECVIYITDMPYVIWSDFLVERIAEVKAWRLCPFPSVHGSIWGNLPCEVDCMSWGILLSCCIYVAVNPGLVCMLWGWISVMVLIVKDYLRVGS
jgi:hypothetical protein